MKSIVHNFLKAFFWWNISKELPQNFEFFSFLGSLFSGSHNILLRLWCLMVSLQVFFGPLRLIHWHQTFKKRLELSQVLTVSDIFGFDKLSVWVKSL